MLDEIAHALTRHFREQGYRCDLTIGILDHPKSGCHHIVLFTQTYKRIGILFLEPTGIVYGQDYFLAHLLGPRYDYADPDLIDQLDRVVRHAYERQGRSWLKRLFAYTKIQ